MSTSKNIFGNLILAGLVVTVMLVLTNCGGDEPPATNRTAGPAAEPAAPAAQSAVTESIEREESLGSVTFMVDGEEKKLEYIPKSASYYSKVASHFRAYSENDSSENFYVNFMVIDLENLSFPAWLPLPRDPKNPMSGMGTVGFGYVNAEGVEWAGPGKIRVVSMNGGVLQGSFDQVSLPHTDKELRDITLTGGTFRVQMKH